MAAINFTPISLYYSTTAAAVPSAGNLVAGELALNTTDEKLYFKNAAGTVKLLASNAATAAGVDSFSGGTTGLTPSTATTGAVTLAGTLANTNGGTGATAAFTQYGITYASSTTVLATTAAGTSTTVLHGNASGAPTFGAVSLTADISGTLPVANGGTGLTSLTAGYVPFGAGTSAFGNSPNLFWDNPNGRLGILTTSPQSMIHLASVGAGGVATARLQGNLGSDGEVSVLNFSNRTDITGGYIIAAVSANRTGDDNSGSLILSTAQGASTPTERFRVGPSGQFGIGGATYGSSGQVLTSGGSSAAPTWTTPAAAFSTSADNTFTGTQTFNGTSSKLAVVLANAAETTNIVAGSNNANSTAYFNTGSVSYYTSNNSSLFTQNLTFSSGTTLNSVMSVGQSITMAILSTNGGTAYYPNGFQVDGSSVTPKWQGGTAPTAGNASSIDVYTYTVIKTASATFTVLASQTKFA